MYFNFLTLRLFYFILLVFFLTQINKFFDAFLLYYKDKDKWDKITEHISDERTKDKLKRGFYGYISRLRRSFGASEVQFLFLKLFSVILTSSLLSILFSERRINITRRTTNALVRNCHSNEKNRASSQISVVLFVVIET